MYYLTRIAFLTRLTSLLDKIKKHLLIDNNLGLFTDISDIENKSKYK